MVNPSEMELAAMQACLIPLGEYVGSIGMQRPLADYRRDEVCMLIGVVITTYQKRMVEEHERLAAKDRAFLAQRLVRQTQTAAQGGPL